LVAKTKLLFKFILAFCHMLKTTFNTIFIIGCTLSRGGDTRPSPILHGKGAETPVRSPRNRVPFAP
jgi:hypothetical protein